MTLTTQNITQVLNAPYFSGSFSQDPIHSASTGLRSENIEMFSKGATDFPRFRTLHSLLASEVRNTAIGRQLRDKPVRVLENGPGYVHFSIAKIVAESGHHYMAKEPANTHKHLVERFIPELASRISYHECSETTPAEIVYWAYPSYNYSDLASYRLDKEREAREFVRLKWYINISGMERLYDFRAALMGAYFGRDVMLGGFLVIASELASWISYNEYPGAEFCTFHPAIWECIFNEWISGSVLPGQWAGHDGGSSLMILRRQRIS